MVEGRKSKSRKLKLFAFLCSIMSWLGIVEESLVNIAVVVSGCFTFTTVVEKAGDMARELLKVSIGLVPGVIVEGDDDFRNLDGVVVEGGGIILQGCVDISRVFLVVVLDFFRRLEKSASLGTCSRNQVEKEAAVTEKC